MKNRTRHFVVNPKVIVGGSLASALLIAGLGAAVPSSGATTIKSAAPSAFCKTLLSLQKVKQPTTTNISNYRKWIKTYLPFYKKLASEAPTGSSKKVLSELVTLMQYESKTTSAVKLDGYIATHSTQWANGWKAFVTSAITCVTTSYG